MHDFKFNWYDVVPILNLVKIKMSFENNIFHTSNIFSISK